MMIAVCLQNENEQSPIDSRFGRAGCFGIFSNKDKSWTFIPNEQNLNAASGAGIQAAQQVIDAGANAVIGCNFGPKAAAALQAAGIEMYQAQSDMTGESAIQAHQKGQLKGLDGANAEAHWV